MDLPTPRHLQQSDLLEGVVRREMTSLIARWAPSDGEHRTAVPSLALFRRSSPSECESCIAKPSLVLAVQGQKRVVLAGESYDYGPMNGLVTLMDLPIMARVVTASAEEPNLCLTYELDLQTVARLMSEMDLSPPRFVAEGRALSLCPVSGVLLDVMLRFLRLLDEPTSIPILGPLVERELLYRLLTSEHGMLLRHLAMAESQTGKIARAITFLRQHYAEPLRIVALADHVGMSVSSLHHHFKAVTSMSPLQYQKHLRLHEARQILIRSRSDVTSAAYNVGYESPSQFSRDYSRLFGVPPSKDVGLSRRGEAGRTTY